MNENMNEKINVELLECCVGLHVGNFRLGASGN